MNAEIYKCPVCGLPMAKSEKSFFCEKKHSFDIAAKGYINLLLSNQKHSKNPGDSKEMLVHRKNFLNSGFYEPLLKEIYNLINTFNPENNEALNILDLGCGEGYYTCSLKALMDKSGQDNNYFGIDIAKEAIALAARRNCSIDFIVGNSFALPFQDESFDLIICIFSQLSEPEIKRVLKKNGRIIIAGPDSKHLNNFIRLIYDKPHSHTSKNSLNSNDSFQLTEKKNLNFILELRRQEDISNLFTMTPYYWQAPPEKQKHILDLTELDVEVDFNIEIFEKK